MTGLLVLYVALILTPAGFCLLLQAADVIRPRLRRALDRVCGPAPDPISQAVSLGNSGRELPARPASVPPAAPGTNPNLPAGHDCGPIVMDVWFHRCGCSWARNHALRTVERAPCDRHAFDVDHWNERLANS
jgi:hypothetical protein